LVMQVYRPSSNNGGGGASLPYLSYIASITHDDPNPPSVNVIYNDIGNIVWTRGETGYYYGTLEGAFPSGKVYLNAQYNGHDSDLAIRIDEEGDDNSILLENYKISDSSNADYLLNAYVEIRVYPSVGV